MKEVKEETDHTHQVVDLWSNPDGEYVDFEGSYADCFYYVIRQHNPHMYRIERVNTPTHNHAPHKIPSL